METRLTPHPNAVFYINLFDDPAVRKRVELMPLSEIQFAVNSMEGHIPHDELPPCYDWLVGLRNKHQQAAPVPARVKGARKFSRVCGVCEGTGSNGDGYSCMGCGGTEEV